MTKVAKFVNEAHKSMKSADDIKASLIIKDEFFRPMGMKLDYVLNHPVNIINNFNFIASSFKSIIKI